MPKHFEARGVPRSIFHDAWWLDPASGPADTKAAASKGIKGGWSEMPVTTRRQWIGLVGLILLADFLFWQQEVGLSLAIFALGLVLASGMGLPVRSRIKGGLVGLIGALPVIDYVQPLSLVWLAAGVSAAIVMQHAAGEVVPRLIARSFGFLLCLPAQWLQSLALSSLLRPKVRSDGASFGVKWLKDWAFPLGGSLVFLALLMDANPLFLSLGSEVMSPWVVLKRVMFWAGIALFILPFLRPSLPERQVPNLPRPQLPGMGLNAGSVLRALIMFNVLIGAQMISDAAVLAGGAELPMGMTYAEYAHRGAYPLLATAMLAMGFALVSRPFWDTHDLIRPLMLLWLGQNFALTGAAALRLDLYIDAYGQTYLRLYALIWMALVAFGLLLAGLQMLLNRSTSWLVARAAVGAAIVLYVCAFVNFAGIIATHNLARSGTDLDYLCDLGPMASGAFALAQKTAGNALTPLRHAPYPCAAAKAPSLHGWRDWGFRSWQVNHMVAAARLPEPA